MSKKIIIFSIAISCVILLGIVVLVGSRLTKSKDYDKYFVVKENLYLDEKAFTKEYNNFAAITLGEQIGITDENQQVYAIGGLKEDEWICVRSDGLEHIYRQISVPKISLGNLNVSKLQIKDELALGGIQTYITDKSIVDAIMGDVTDKNLVNAPTLVSVVKQVNIYFDEFPTLYYILYYLHNDTDGCFLLDPITNETWMIGHELMMQLN